MKRGICIVWYALFFMMIAAAGVGIPQIAQGKENAIETVTCCLMLAGFFFWRGGKSSAVQKDPKQEQPTPEREL